MVRLLQAAEGVDDVHRRMPAMLDTTDPKELKAILAHSIERIEVAGAQATFCYTFAEPKAEFMPSTGDPEGLQGLMCNTLFMPFVMTWMIRSQILFVA